MELRGGHCGEGTYSCIFSGKKDIHIFRSSRFDFQKSEYPIAKNIMYSNGHEPFQRAIFLFDSTSLKVGAQSEEQCRINHIQSARKKLHIS